MTPLAPAVSRLPGEVPVVPDAPTGRRWATEELLDPIYHDQPSLLDRFITWVLDLLEGTSTNLGVPAPAATLIAIVVVAAVAILLFLFTGPVRRRRRARPSATVFTQDHRTAAELRAAADAHASAGRWTEAVLERFRALVRSLEERALLDERPGRTAHEAVLEASRHLPDLAKQLARAGDLFDDTCYGDLPGTAQDHGWMAELDERVAATRPTVEALATAGAVP